MVPVGEGEQPVFADGLAQVQHACGRAEGIVGGNGLFLLAGGDPGPDPASRPSVCGRRFCPAQAAAARAHGRESGQPLLPGASAVHGDCSPVGVAPIAGARRALQHLHPLDTLQGEVVEAGIRTGRVSDADAVEQDHDISGPASTQVKVGPGARAAVGLDLAGQQERQDLSEVLGSALLDGLGAEHLHRVRGLGHCHVGGFGRHRDRRSCLGLGLGSFRGKGVRRQERGSQSQKEGESGLAHRMPPRMEPGMDGRTGRPVLLLPRQGWDRLDRSPGSHATGTFRCPRKPSRGRASVVPVKSPGLKIFLSPVCIPLRGSAGLTPASRASSTLCSP